MIILMKFTESKLEQAFTSLLAKEGYPYFLGDSIERNPKMVLAESEVLIEDDLRKYFMQVSANQVTVQVTSKLPSKYRASHRAS